MPDRSQRRPPRPLLIEGLRGVFMLLLVTAGLSLVGLTVAALLAALLG